MGFYLNLLTTCLILMIVLASQANSANPSKVFDVRDSGAVADGETDATKAFLSAWGEACEMKGRSRVLIPEGTFRVGPVVFRGPCKGLVVVQVKGVVRAPSDLNAFQSDGWVHFQYIDGLIVTGDGKFDGQGASAWQHNQCAKQDQCKKLPTSLRFSFITNATIRGISSVDSKLCHMLIFASKNIRLHNIKISAPGDSPNTDGIHIGSSSDIKISHSTIGTGDDCISIGAGTRNLDISNVFCGSGHGISVGSLGKSEDEEDVAGLRVSNCTLTGTKNGVRIKTWQASSEMSASNFTFEDIVMNDVFNPINIDQKYCPHNTCNAESPSRVKINNVKFQNIRGTSATKFAVKLLCSETFPCQNVELRDINLVYNGQVEATMASCSNVHGTASGRMIPSSCI